MFAKQSHIQPACLAAALLTAAAAQPALAHAGIWTTNGPFGGIVDSIVVDPSTPSTIYEASPLGGVFKSVDQGKTWVASSNGLDDPVVSTLVMDPTNPQTLYAGCPSGLYVSLDGGASWQITSKEIGVKQLAIDPLTPTRIYAISTVGPAYVSNKGGHGWTLLSTELPTGLLYALAVDPVDSKNVYIGAYGGLWKSTNEGKHWTLITNGLGSGTPIVQSLFINPASPAILYAQTGQGLEKSGDGGKQWNVLTSVPQPFNFQMFGLNPQNPKILYGEDFPNTIYTSPDSGSSWVKLGALSASFQGYVRTVAVDPTNQANLFAGTDQGIFASSTQGNAWTQQNAGLANTAVVSLAADPKSPGTFYAGTEYSGIFKTTDSGKTWTLIYPDWTDKPLSLTVDPKTPSTLYFGSTFHAGLFGSTDSGVTWTNLLPTQVFSMALNPKSPSTLYAGSGSVPLYVSTNGGQSWTQETNGLLGVSPASLSANGANVLIADPNSGVYLSADSGKSWTLNAPAEPISAGLLYTYQTGKVSALAGASYASSGTLGYSLDSTKGGAGWIAWPTPTGKGAGACAPVNAIAINPKAPTTFYAGTACGVLQGANNGAQLAPLSKGLPAGVPVNAIALVPSGKTVLAGTYGRGVYTYVVPK